MRWCCETRLHLGDSGHGAVGDDTASGAYHQSCSVHGLLRPRKVSHRRTLFWTLFAVARRVERSFWLFTSHSLPALAHFAHALSFVNFYVVVSDDLADDVAIIPNAVVLKVARSYSMPGCHAFLSMFSSLRLDKARSQILIP